MDINSYLVINNREEDRMKLKPLVYGTIAGAFVWIAAFFLAGLILYVTGAGDFFVIAAVKIIIALASIAAGFVAGKMCNSRRFLWGLGSGMALFIITLALGTFIGGNGGFAKDEIINMIIFAAFSFSGGIIS